MKKYTKLITLFMVSVVIVAALCVSAPAAEFSWTGTWETQWGDMTLTQTDSKVTGKYTHDGGTISGTVSGNVLSGTWEEPGQKGKIKFVMSADGKSFTGGWGYNDAAPSTTGWDGKRKTAVTYVDGSDNKATASASLSDVKWDAGSQQLSFTIKYANVGSDAWVGIVPSGTADDEKSADDADVTYKYLSSVTSGSKVTLSSSNIKTGKYELRVYDNDNGGTLLAREKFTVSDSSGVTTSDTMLKIILEEGERVRIGAIIGGKNASSVTYSSSDSKVAKVTEKGKIIAVSVGNATITAKSGDMAIKVYVEVEEDD